MFAIVVARARFAACQPTAKGACPRSVWNRRYAIFAYLSDYPGRTLNFTVNCSYLPTRLEPPNSQSCATEPRMWAHEPQRRTALYMRNFRKHRDLDQRSTWRESAHASSGMLLHARDSLPEVGFVPRFRQSRESSEAIEKACAETSRKASEA